MRGTKNLGGRYKLGRTIGHGTFGKVKEAVNIKTGATVAVKILSLKTIDKHGLHRTVQTEVTALKRLPKHKHVVNMYEVLRSADSFYFIIELVKGGELFDKIQSEGAFDEDKARMYFKQLISGLEFMHRHKICHRDLKLENLLVDENGILKITDFGLSGLHKEKRRKSKDIARPVEEQVSSLRPPEDRASDMLTATTSASSAGTVSVTSVGTPAGSSSSMTSTAVAAVTSASSTALSTADGSSSSVAAIPAALPTAAALSADSVAPKTVAPASSSSVSASTAVDSSAAEKKSSEESESEYSSDDREGVDGIFTTTLGSPNYVAPEVLNGRGYDGYMADIWSSGIILYALVAGFLPFDEESPTMLFQKICTGDLMYPETFSNEIIDLLNNMLQVDPTFRYTLSEIKRHVWFNDQKLKVDEHGRRVSLCSILDDPLSVASGAPPISGGSGISSAHSTPVSMVGSMGAPISPRGVTGGGGMMSSSIGGADGELRIEVVEDFDDDVSVTGGIMREAHHWVRPPPMSATVTSSTGPGTATTKTTVTSITGSSRTVDSTMSSAVESVTIDDSSHSGSSRKSRSASLGDGHSLRGSQMTKKHGKSDSLVIRVEGYSSFKGGSLGSADLPEIDQLSPSPSPFMMESTASGMVSDASGNELKPFPITAFDLIGIVSTQMLSNVFTRSLHEPHLTKTYSRFVTKANPAKILWVIHQAAYRMPECTYTMSAHNCYELTMVKFFGGGSECIIANVTVYHTPADEYVVECRRKQGNIFKYRDFFDEFQKTYFDVLHRLAKVTEVDGAPAFGWTATAADASSTSAKSARGTTSSKRSGGGSSSKKGSRPRSTKSVGSRGHSSHGSSEVDLSVLSVASDDAASSLGVTAIARGGGSSSSTVGSGGGRRMPRVSHERASSASGAPDTQSTLKPSTLRKKSKRSSSDIGQVKKPKGTLSVLKEDRVSSTDSSKGAVPKPESLKLSMASRVARKKSSQSSTASSAEGEFTSVVPRTSSLGTTGLVSVTLGPGSSRSLASDSSPLMCSVTPTQGDGDESYFHGGRHSPHVSTTTDSGGGLMLSHTSGVSTDSASSDTHVRYPSTSVTQSSSTVALSTEEPMPHASSLTSKADEHHLKLCS